MMTDGYYVTVVLLDLQTIDVIAERLNFWLTAIRISVGYDSACSTAIDHGLVESAS